MSSLADAADAVLEWSVGGSFTRIGSSVRRRLEHWAPIETVRLDGRVIVMTGATSGLGASAALAFAHMGATLEIIARNPSKAEATCASLRQASGNQNIRFVIADTGELPSLRTAAAEILSRHPAIHVLIHNAGALDDAHHVNTDGLEFTVASQVVGPFLLTGLLLPALRAGAPSRVLWVSSGGMYSEPLRVDSLEMSAQRYNGTAAYARAKRAQVTLAQLWAERLTGDGIAVQVMHPGWADTPGVARSLPIFRQVLGPLLRTPADGADTLVWLASAEGPPVTQTGSFWLDRRARPIHRMASTQASDTPEERARLWAWAEAKSGWVATAAS
jgi:NAD(P)-dependent dehydrogenase (short-subunit alcohol dehydrogenase family)